MMRTTSKLTNLLACVLTHCLSFCQDGTCSCSYLKPTSCDGQTLPNSCHFSFLICVLNLSLSRFSYIQTSKLYFFICLSIYLFTYLSRNVLLAPYFPLAPTHFCTNSIAKLLQLLYSFFPLPHHAPLFSFHPG